MINSNALLLWKVIQRDNNHEKYNISKLNKYK